MSEDLGWMWGWISLLSIFDLYLNNLFRLVLYIFDF